MARHEVDHEALLDRLVPGDAESWEVLYTLRQSEAKIAALGWGLFSLLFLGVGASMIWLAGKDGSFEHLDQLSRTDLVALGVFGLMSFIGLWGLKSSVGDLLLQPRVTTGKVEGIEKHSRSRGRGERAVYFLRACRRLWDISEMDSVERQKLSAGQEVMIEASAGSHRVISLLRRR